MLKLLQHMLVLGVGLVTAVPGEAGLGGFDPIGQQKQEKKPQRAPAARRATPKPKRSAARSQQAYLPKSRAAKAQQDAQRTKERRRAANHIAAAFPRTRRLLGYLEKNDGAALDAILNHSVKLARRREAAALRLAKEHHPELLKLILRSKRRYPKAYNSAIRELVVDYARLQRAKQVGDKDFDVALDEWKLRSKARLVAARMTVANQPELQKQLEALLTQGERAKRRQVQLQIQRYREQIQRLQRRLDQDPVRNVKRQLRGINNRVKPNKRRGK